MLMECLIKRDGDTEVTVGGIPYRFSKNEHGHMVCDVVSDGAVSYLKSLPFYRPYEPPEEKADDTDDEIARLRDEGLSYQKIGDHLGLTKSAVHARIKKQEKT